MNCKYVEEHQNNLLFLQDVVCSHKKTEMQDCVNFQTLEVVLVSQKNGSVIFLDTGQKESMTLRKILLN